MSVIYIQLDGEHVGFCQNGARKKCKRYSIVDSGPNLVLLEESEPNGPFIALTPRTNRC